jgi:hypothetical protein
VYVNLLSTVSPALLLIAGFVVCFFGYRLLRLTLGLAGFGVGLASGLAIAGIIPDASQVLTIIIGIVCGILGAILAALVYKLGVFLLGAGAGVLVASIVLAATAWHHPMLIRLAAAIAGGILTLILERPLVSILSALAGGLGTAAGTFELLGWYRIATGVKTPPANYGAMIACGLILGLIGAGVQLRTAGRRGRDRRRRPPSRPPASHRGNE